MPSRAFGLIWIGRGRADDAVVPGMSVRMIGTMHAPRHEQCSCLTFLVLSAGRR